MEVRNCTYYFGHVYRTRMSFRIRVQRLRRCIFLSGSVRVVTSISRQREFPVLTIAVLLVGRTAAKGLGEAGVVAAGLVVATFPFLGTGLVVHAPVRLVAVGVMVAGIWTGILVVTSLTVMMT